MTIDCSAGLLHRPTPTTDTLGIVAALNWQAQQTLPQWGPGGPPSDGNGMPVRASFRILSTTSQRACTGVAPVAGMTSSETGESVLDGQPQDMEHSDGVQGQMGLLSGGLSLGGASMGSFGKLGMLPSLGSMGSFNRSMGMSNSNGGQLGGQRMSEGVLLQLAYLLLSDFVSMAE